MKSKLKYWGSAALVALLVGCSDNDGGGPTPTPAGSTCIQGTISADTTITKGAEASVNCLDGFVYVDAGATLTIEAGATIASEGKSALIVKQGGKLMAVGTASEPIVFTSSEATKSAGDWAGVVIFGNAPVSTSDSSQSFEASPEDTFGGKDTSDNSGTIKYVRIEYAGWEVSTDNELNGLTLGGVGSGTTVEYVQVHEGKDDGIEWFGGNVHSKYLLVTGGQDDGLDIDEGYNGKSEFMLVRQGPESDKGIEAGDAAVNANHITAPSWSNITIFSDSGKTAVSLKNNVSGTYSKMLVVGNQSKSAIEAKGSVTLSKISSGETKFPHFFHDGAFSTPFNTDGDEAALAIVQAFATNVPDAINDDFTPKAQVLIDSAVGAIVGENWTTGWTVGLTPATSVANPILSGTVSGTLDASITYEIQGLTYVESGETLTIPAGTMIKSEGKSALIVKRGGILNANGTKDKPIVFTSKKATPAAGDWAGVVIFGKAPVSTADSSQTFEASPDDGFGGKEAADNSGSLKYVRIEYAGWEVSTDNELNGLTLGGVGSGTTIEYVQVHEGKDDGIEWFGGTVNSSYLIVTGGLDDGLDIDEGYIGNSQYMMVVQGPDSDKAIEAGSVAVNPNHITAPTWSNMTIVTATDKTAFSLKDNVSGSYSKVVVVGNNSKTVFEAKGSVTLAKIADASTTLEDFFYDGVFATPVNTDGDEAAAAIVTASITVAADALKSDYSANDQAVVDASAGAIVNGNLWYEGWSKVDPLTVNSAVPDSTVLSGNISTNTKLVADSVWELSGFVYVDSGATLTIEPGTKIMSEGKSALIVSKGGQINAAGTAAKPIVFTSKKATPAAGDWAGVVIFGRAPVSTADSSQAFEASPEDLFGGKNAADNSGVLRYVRIEYAGWEVSAENELNGLTLGGVGTGTQIEYVQVHEGKDDGIEWFGGNVNSKYLVVTGGQDDALDIDEGYTGTSQYMLVVQGDESDKGIEAGDAGTNPNHITAPTWSNLTIITEAAKTAISLKDQVSGAYTKMVVVGKSAKSLIDAKGSVTLDKIKDTAGTQFTDVFWDGSFTTPVSADGDDAAVAILTAGLTQAKGALNSDYTPAAQTVKEAQAGAIVGDDNWTTGWTTGLGTLEVEAPDSASDSSNTLSGNITKDTTLVASREYSFSGFVYVEPNVTLTIEPGTVIKSTGKSALIVKKGAKINAVGTKDKPIVMTSANSSPAAGDWAGVVIFGQAPVSTADSSQSFEASPDDSFGGKDTSDNSGSMQYVRIEYAGWEVSTDNELNGLTLGGVGKGTTLSHVQVHEGKDDGIEWFGGNLTTSHLIVTGGQDDGLDIDEGYNGTSSHMIVKQGAESDKAIEAGDAAVNPNHITEPNWSNVTIVVGAEKTALSLKNNVSGTFSKFVVWGATNPKTVIDAKGDVTLSKINDQSTKFQDFFWAGTYSAALSGDGDAAAEAILAASVTEAQDALNADLSPKAEAVKTANAGAIEGTDLWYQGWSVAVP